MICSEAAKHHYEHALEIAKNTQDHYTEGLAYRNLGIAYMRKNLFSLAEDCFRQALQIKEYEPTLYGLRTMYNLTHVLYKTGNTEEAREWCEKGLVRVEEAGEEEYLAKFNLVYSLYDQCDIGEIRDALEFLESSDLWHDVAELTLEVGCHFKRTGDSDNASYYFLKSIEARDQILRMTGELK